MKIIRWSLLLISFLILLVFGFSWMLSNRILFPVSSLEQTKSRITNEWGTTYEAMLADLPEPQDFSFNSFDETPIKGKYFAKSDTTDCAIIFSHGWTSTWAGMLKYVPVLSDCHCDLVLYDHRAHGESGGVYATGGVKEAKDLLALTEWVKKEKDYTGEQIGWVGASWGGATVLTAGAASENVAFIIADAPFQNWTSAIFERGVRDYGTGVNMLIYPVMNLVGWRAGINYEDASAVNIASKIEEPVLLIHSQQDSQTASSQSVNIAAKLNPSTSSFHHTDWGGDHTHDVRINKERFQELINTFLAEKASHFLRLEEEARFTEHKVTEK